MVVLAIEEEAMIPSGASQQTLFGRTLLVHLGKEWSGIDLSQHGALSCFFLSLCVYVCASGWVHALGVTVIDCRYRTPVLLC